MVKNEDVIKSFLKDEPKKTKNLESKDGTLFLYGNKIAYKPSIADHEFIIYYRYNSRTTTKILNMLPNVKVNRKGGQKYLNNNLWLNDEAYILNQH